MRANQKKGKKKRAMLLSQESYKPIEVAAPHHCDCEAFSAPRFESPIRNERRFKAIKTANSRMTHL
ncbi:MAG: hypothetical protein JRM77_09250 [Nitrososphaerota archaeon]|nr:hypothetical protein [Nitrososphaerota archaeon]